ncbi:MAG: hypothetical protein N2376_10730, partial [Clostridia bacterium]|nr:hypothetical protein [Clostridia bacterium]
FGLGRMIRSLADEHHAPRWLKDEHDVPRRGILFSGLGMLAALGFGLFFPSVYLFLISSGGFAVLFTYAVIIATQIRFRKKFGCPPEGKCQMPGYPVASWLVLLVMVVAIVSMPFIPEQAPGMIAGILMVILFVAIYVGIKVYKHLKKGYSADDNGEPIPLEPRYSTEFSEELHIEDEDFEKADHSAQESLYEGGQLNRDARRSDNHGGVPQGKNGDCQREAWGETQTGYDSEDEWPQL